MFWNDKSLSRQKKKNEAKTFLKYIQLGPQEQLPQQLQAPVPQAPVAPTV